jgi:hypothetical protein
MDMKTTDEHFNAAMDELASLGTKITDYAKEAIDHFKKGNPQAACDVISLAHYPIGQADHSRDYIVKMFEKRGIRPGGGR